MNLKVGHLVGTLSDGKTSQMSRYHKFLIYLVVLIVISCPFLSNSG